MKKLLFILTVLLVLFAVSSCAQQETPTLEAAFPTAESVNGKIGTLGEVTDIQSAAFVIEIFEDYQSLPDFEQRKVVGIENVIGSLETALSFFDKDAMTIKVMSFNILCSDLTEDRMQRVIDTIRTESPDVVGLQEGTDLLCRRIIKALGDEYEMLGHGREAKKDGENNNILYRKDAFELIESQTYWLTDTPEVFSKHPESNCYRIFTYQLLRRKSDGQVFLHVNTHFDHVGANARIEQANILTDWIEKTYKNQFPVAITGDFNCAADTVEYQTIIDAGYRVSNTYGESTRTFHGFNEDWGTIIDFCFVNELFPVVSYKVCDAKQDGQWISDHNAIVTELLLFPTSDSIEIPEETD